MPLLSKIAKYIHLCLKKQPKHVPTSRWYSKTNFYVPFQQFPFSLKGKQKRESLNS